MRKILLIICLAAAAMPLAGESRDISSYFNGPALGFVLVRNPARLVKDARATEMGKLWQEPEVQTFLAPLLDKARVKFAAAAAKTEPVDIKKIIGLLSRAQGGLGLALTGFDLQVGAGPPAGGFAVIRGIDPADREFFRNLVFLLEGILKADPDVIVTSQGMENASIRVIRHSRNQWVVCYRIFEDGLLLAIGEEAMAAALANARKARTEPSLMRPMEYCGPGEAGGVLIHLDIPRITQVVKAHTRAVQGLQAPALRVIDILRPEEIRSLTLHSSAFKEGFYNRILLAMQAEKIGIARIFDGTNIPMTALKRIPREVSHFQIMHLDLAELWDITWDMADKLAPPQAAAARDYISAFEEVNTIAIREGLLDSLDGEWVLYQAMPDDISGLQTPRLTIIAGLRDAGPWRRLMDTYVVPVAKRNGLNIQKSAAVGGDIYTAQIPMLGPLAPGIAITESQLVLASTRDALNEALGPRPQENITAHVEYRRLAPYMAVKGPLVSLAFSDLRGMVRLSYGLIANPALGASRLEKVGLDITKMPLTETVVKHLIGMKSIIRHEGNDIYMETFGPVDSLMLLTAGAASLAMFGSDGAAAIPAVEGGALPGPGEVSAADAQLTRLYDACTIYTFDHGGRFPARLSRLHPEYIDDLKVFAVTGETLTPKMIDAQGAVVIIAGVDPMDSDTTILLHERIGAGTVSVRVLYVGGRITSLSPAKLKAALKKQASE